MKIVKLPKDSNFLLKGVIVKIEKGPEAQINGFFSLKLYTLGAGLLGRMLAGKGAIRAGERLIRE